MHGPRSWHLLWYATAHPSLNSLHCDLEVFLLAVPVVFAVLFRSLRTERANKALAFTLESKIIFFCWGHDLLEAINVNLFWLRDRWKYWAFYANEYITISDLLYLKSCSNDRPYRMFSPHRRHADKAFVSLVSFDFFFVTTAFQRFKECKRN